MKRLIRLSCALFLPLALLLGACSDTPETGGGGGGTDGGPAITSFTANPPTVRPGGESTLTWEVADATSLTLRQSVGENIGEVSVTTSSYVVTPLETTSYTLDATDAQGTVSQETTVTVEDVSEDLSQVGFVNLDEQTPPTGAANVVASGIFLEFTEGEKIPDTFFNNPFEGRLDTCDVTFTAPEEGDADILPPFTPAGTPAYISAGAQITLMAGSNTYATLEKRDETINGDNATFYSVAALSAPPAELTATVPGDELEFPAFAAVPLPNVAPFTLTAPAGTDPVAPTTPFTWDAGGNADAVVLIKVTDVDETGNALTVSCTAQDDGSFVLPDETREALGDTFEGSLVSAGRQAFRTEIKGEAVLVLGGSSTQFFGPLPTGIKASFWTSQF